LHNINQVSWEALKKRHDQGWLVEIAKDLDHLVERIQEAKRKKESTSIGYHGNVVDLWEKLAAVYEKTGERLVDLGSDQTSLHIPYDGGYYPVDLSYEEGQAMIVANPLKFKTLVHASLRRQAAAIRKLTDAGMFFWDYGNAFLLESSRAGADVMCASDPTRFIYPSYVEAVMGYKMATI